MKINTKKIQAIASNFEEKQIHQTTCSEDVVKCKILIPLPFSDMCKSQPIQNITPSVNVTQQDINATGTECQQIYSSYLRLTNSNNYVLEYHQLY